MSTEPTGTPAAERDRWRRTRTIEWFSVDDRLPGVDELVLVHRPGYGETVWLGYRTDMIGVRDMAWLGPDGVLLDGITHWADLPEPPAKCDGE